MGRILTTDRRGTRAYARIGELALRYKPDGSGDVGRRWDAARGGGALGLLFSGPARHTYRPDRRAARGVTTGFFVVSWFSHWSSSLSFKPAETPQHTANGRCSTRGEWDRTT